MAHWVEEVGKRKNPQNEASDQIPNMVWQREMGRLETGRKKVGMGVRFLWVGIRFGGWGRWWAWIGAGWTLGVSKAISQRNDWKPPPFPKVPCLFLPLGQMLREQLWKVQKEDHDCMNHRRGSMKDQGSQQGALSQTELQGMWWAVLAALMELRVQTASPCKILYLAMSKREMSRRQLDVTFLPLHSLLWGDFIKASTQV